MNQSIVVVACCIAFCASATALGQQPLTPQTTDNAGWNNQATGEVTQPQTAAQPQMAAQPQLPPGFPLDPEMQAYIEQLLAFWEGTAAQVTHYQCTFRRWEFDQERCNWRNPDNGHLVACIVSRGTIRYRQPDNGMYEVTEKWKFAGPPDTGSKEPKYERLNKDNAEMEKEKWICDGQSIFTYHFVDRRLEEFRLPPEAQGEGLKNSPLPFVFGAKAVELLDRYWIRDITPAGVTDSYWLEAWPRRASDAQTYSRMEIHLSREPFLPVAIHLYAPNYDEKTNPSKIALAFEQRQVNGTLHGLLDAFFIRPSTPFGWERVEVDGAAQAAAQEAAARAAQNAPSTESAPQAPNR